MNAVQSLQKLEDSLKRSTRMPVVFLGHGSPMNVIEDNVFSRRWTELGRILPRPQAIVVVSAHWMTPGSTKVDSSAMPRTIYDFSGFPDALYAQKYPAKGDPQLAQEITALLADYNAQTDNSWGLDHGAWSVLKWLYPKADLPVFQLSIDTSKDLDWQLSIGKTLSELRDRGVLILGSGNVVHNLRALRFNGQAHDWAVEFDNYFVKHLTERNFSALTDVKEMGALMQMANPTLEHYAPALTIAGASGSKDELYFVTEGIELGAISMRSFIFHSA